MSEHATVSTEQTPRPDPVLAAIIGALRTKKWLRVGVSMVSVVTMGVAVIMLGYPAYTNFYTSRLQSKLSKELAAQSLLQAYQQNTVPAVGSALTRISIPKLDVSTVVVEGTTASALRAGAGHYPDSALPCNKSNRVAIAGHRTTYGRPFAQVDLLKAGDEITLETPIGTCMYRVTKTEIVFPNNLSVVAPTPGHGQLTLTTCHPKHSAKQRLIVHADFVSLTPPGSA